MAAQAQPPTDWSFYILDNSTSEAYTLGCNQGKFDASVSPPRNSEVVLDFGAQTSDGSQTETPFTGVFLTDAQVEAIAEQFSAGYFVCTGPDTSSVMRLGIGTNNSVLYSSSSAYTTMGKTWATVISTIANSNKSNSYSSQVSVLGASDIESWYYPSTGFYVPASDTTAWVQGYASSNPASYINFGSADGCPSSGYANAACSAGYNQYDYWYYTWGSPPAQGAPEIYTPTNAAQWTQISLYASHYQNGMAFQGPWDEWAINPSTYDSSQAWTAFANDLSNAGVTAGMPYSLEIHCEKSGTSCP